MWNSTKISVTLGMHLTQGGHVQRPLMCGPSGMPADQTPWPAGPTLQPPVSFLGGDALQEAVEWNPRPRVGGGHPPWSAGHAMSFLCGDTLQKAMEWNPRPRVGGGHAPWLASHVARPAGQHLVNYRLNQVGNCSCDSYKYPLPMEFTQHSTCSSPLVKVRV
jgi:hypothetical protein